MLRLGKSVGSGQRNDEDDVEAFDNAMREIGAYTPPSEYAMAPQRYLTEPVVDALKQFQEQKGIKIDGYAEPGGETERAINNDLLGKPRGAGLPQEFDITLDDSVGNGLANKEHDVKTAKRALGALDYMPENPFDDPAGFIDERMERSLRRFQEDNGLKPDGWMRPGGETETALREAVSKLKSTMRPVWEAYERKVQSTEGAAEPAQFIRPRPLPGGQSWPPTQVPDGDLPEWSARDLPLLPPLLPPLLDERSIFDRIFGPRRDANPIPPEFRGFKDVTPTAGPAIFDGLIFPRRGNEETQALNDRVGKEFMSIAARYGCRPFDHEGGARKEFKSDGDKKSEKYIPPREKLVDGTGRTTTKGGAYGDVHLKTSVNGRIRHVVLQTVDVAASGAPTARELANAAKILRNGGKDFYVLLFPKLPKGWDYDRGAFTDLTRRMLDMVCSEDERDDPQADRKLQLDNTVPKR